MALDKHPQVDMLITLVVTDDFGLFSHSLVVEVADKLNDTTYLPLQGKLATITKVKPRSVDHREQDSISSRLLKFDNSSGESWCRSQWCGEETSKSSTLVN